MNDDDIISYWIKIGFIFKKSKKHTVYSIVYWILMFLIIQIYLGTLNTA